MILAVLTVIAGFVVFDEVGEALGFPGGFGEFVWLHEPHEYEFHADTALLSTVFAGAGVVVAWFLWRERAEAATRIRETFSPIATLFSRPLSTSTTSTSGSSTHRPRPRRRHRLVRPRHRERHRRGRLAGLTYFTGFSLKFTETGKLPNYALAIVAGVILVGILFLVFEA